MTDPIEIVGLRPQGADLNRFLALSEALLSADPRWVPPLRSEQRKLLSPANPFFHHAQAQLWIARRRGQDAGRLAGILDPVYQQHQNQNAAFFGFFESVHDPAVAQALFATLDAWARSHGADQVIGPMNPSTNEDCGLLVDGFEHPPVLMTSYNPPYYPALLDQIGFSKLKDLLAYQIRLADCPLAKLDRIVARVQRQLPHISFRPVRKATVRADLEKVLHLYNDAWQENWGFVPMSEAEVRYLAQRLIPLLFEGLVWIAETADQAVGLLLALPDHNQALKHLRGRLLSPGLLRALPLLLGWQRPRTARVIVLGVRAGFRGRGLESVLLAKGLQAGIRAGFTQADASWVLEDNVQSRRIIEHFGGRIYKRYRIYQRAVP